MAWSTLHPLEIGIRFNHMKMKAEPKTYESGRYFLGFGQKFYKYPRSLQYIEFSNSADGGSSNKPASVWSQDGQEIILEVGFYYKIVPERLFDLFQRYFTNYVPVIEDIAMHAFRDVATSHDTIEFFTNRSAINTRLHEELEERLLDEVHVTVPRFNLLAITVPARFEEAVVDKVVTAQEKRTLEFERQSAIIRQNIRVIEAEAAKNIRIVTAQSEANGTVTLASAEARAYRSVLTRQAELHADLARALDFTLPCTAGVNETCPALADVDEALLLQYMQMDVMQGKVPGSRLVLNYNDATLPEVLQV
jgi:regulator of protease activity HflC (stomatin/prohibitin superfamily)